MVRGTLEKLPDPLVRAVLSGLLIGLPTPLATRKNCTCSSLPKPLPLTITCPPAATEEALMVILAAAACAIGGIDTDLPAPNAPGIRHKISSADRSNWVWNILRRFMIASQLVSTHACVLPEIGRASCRE